MEKIFTLEQVERVAKQLKSQGRTIVLVGGCFDILHIGHVVFLQKAKEKADKLLVLLESDEAVREFKGENRPINTQEDRAQVLVALRVVDYVILLPKKLDDKMYDQIIFEIKPDILATTHGDPQRHHKERQAKFVKAEVVDIIERLEDQSTTRLAKLLKEEYGL